MVKLVDKNALVKNVSLRKSNLIETLTKDAASVVDTEEVRKSADQIVTDVTNSVSTAAGSIAGQVTGGIESLTSKIDAYQDKLNNTTVEGLLSDGAESLEGMATDMVNDQIAGLASKLGLGASVELVFSEPDSDGIVYPIESTLVADGGLEGTIAAILQLITGLGVGPGSLQQMITEASPAGLLEAGKGLGGKLGAFTSDLVQELSTTAITSVTDEIANVVGTVTDINRTIFPFEGVDSNGILTRSAGIVGTGPTGQSEYDASIVKVKNSPIADIAAKLNKTKEVKQSLTGAVNDLQNLSGGTDGKEVLSSVQTQNSSKSKYVRITDQKRSLIKSRAGNTDIGLIQFLSAESLTSIKQTVTQFISPKVVSGGVLFRIISGAQGDAQQFDNAVKTVERLTNKPYDEIKTFLLTIDSTITAATREIPKENIFEPPYVIGSYEKSWKKGKSDEGEFSFPYISSTEELHAELKNIKREVTEFVVHWTETATNKNIGSEEINQWHLESGLEGIGYHYVCRRDGSLQRGRPSNIEGQHDETGHNSKSIAFVFVGGLNIPSGTPNIEDFVSVQSLTRSQFNTFDHFCRSFYSVWPGGQALGHNDIDQSQIDPGFDVRDYVLANFGKKSKFTTLPNQKPFSTLEIVSNDE